MRGTIRITGEFAVATIWAGITQARVTQVNNRASGDPEAIDKFMRE